MENRKKITGAVSALLASTVLIEGGQNAYMLDNPSNFKTTMNASPKILNKRWKTVLGLLFTGGTGGTLGWLFTHLYYKKKNERNNNPKPKIENKKTKDSPNVAPAPTPVQPKAKYENIDQYKDLPEWPEDLPHVLANLSVNEPLTICYISGANFVLNGNQTTKINVPSIDALENQLSQLVPNISQYPRLNVTINRTATFVFEISSSASDKPIKVSYDTFIKELNNGQMISSNPTDSNQSSIPELSAWTTFSQTDPRLQNLNTLPIIPSVNHLLSNKDRPGRYVFYCEVTPSFQIYPRSYSTDPITIDFNNKAYNFLIVTDR